MLLNLLMPHSPTDFTVHCTWLSAVRAKEHEIAQLSALSAAHTPSCCPPETRHALPSSALQMLAVSWHTQTRQLAGSGTHTHTHTQPRIHMNGLGCIPLSQRSVIRWKEHDKMLQHSFVGVHGWRGWRWQQSGKPSKRRVGWRENPDECNEIWSAVLRPDAAV